MENKTIYFLFFIFIAIVIIGIISILYFFNPYVNFSFSEINQNKVNLSLSKISENKKEFNQTDKKVIIRDKDNNKIIDYQLLKNTDECLINCYSEGKSTLYKKGKLFDKIDIYDKYFKKNQINSLKIYILNKSIEQINVSDYKEVCINKLDLNGTGYKDCNNEVIGWHYQSQENNKYIEYNFNELEAGEYFWRIEGIKTPQVKNIDWIGTSNEYNISEFAWWNSSWSKKVQVSIIGGTANLTNFTQFIRLPYDSDMNSTYLDIRILNSSENGEYYFDKDYYNSSEVGLWVNIPLLATTGETIYIYYGNPSASDGQNKKLTYFNATFVYNFAESLTYNSLGYQNGTASGGANIEMGLFGNGSRFDNYNEYVRTNIIPISGKDFTFLCWAYFHTLTTTNDYAGNINWGTWYSHGGGTKFYTKTSGTVLDSGATASTGRWIFVASFQNTSHLNIVVNTTWARQTTTAVLTNNELVIAGNHIGSPTVENGTFDNCVFYNHTKSIDWINRYYQNINTSKITIGSELSTDNNYPVFSNENLNPVNNSVYSYGTSYKFNITVDFTNGTVGLSFNGTNYSMTNSSNNFTYVFPDLKAGYYNYWFWAYGNGSSYLFNYTSSKLFLIQKATPILITSGTTPITYPTLSDIFFNETNYGDGSCNYNINMTNQTFSYGTHQFNYSTAGCENYSEGFSLFNLTVNQNSSVCNLLINTTSPIQYPSSIEIINNCTSTAVMYRNGTVITNGSILQGKAGTYNLSIIRNDSFNYSNNYFYTEFIILKGNGSASTFINGTQSNYSINNGSSVNLTGILSIGNGNILLYDNGVLLNNNTNPIVNITTYGVANIGIHNISTIYQGNENYTEDIETWWIDVSLYTTPTSSTTTLSCNPEKFGYNNYRIPKLEWGVRCSQ